MTVEESESPGRWQTITFAVLAMLLVLRVVFTGISPLNLYADEAQYWRWGLRGLSML